MGWLKDKFNATADLLATGITNTIAYFGGDNAINAISDFSQTEAGKALDKAGTNALKAPGLLTREFLGAQAYGYAATGTRATAAVARKMGAGTVATLADTAADAVDAGYGFEEVLTGQASFSEMLREWANKFDIPFLTPLLNFVADVLEKVEQNPDNIMGALKESFMPSNDGPQTAAATPSAVVPAPAAPATDFEAAGSMAGGIATSVMAGAAFSAAARGIAPQAATPVPAPEQPKPRILTPLALGAP